jgi:hypothetical protein
MKNLNDILEERRTGILKQLDQCENACLKEQRHLDSGTAEQAYWHYGYAMALRDVLELLKSPSTSQH